MVQKIKRHIMNPYALIVTGNPEQAHHYQKALGGIGFQVESVTTGARAQVRLTFKTPDLIVLDMLLPDIPGEVVLRQINACKRLSGTHLIVLSSQKNGWAGGKRPAPFHVLDHAISAADLASLAAGIG